MTLVDSVTPQTGWWKPTADYQKKVWWVTFNGQPVRHATDAEIDLWQELLAARDCAANALLAAGERAAKTVGPFDGLVLSGQTAEDAIRAEFGLPAKQEQFSTERKRVAVAV